jgi:predicted transcriptional regulator
MQSKHALLNVLFPRARAEIFRLLFGSKKRPRYVREIMGDSGLALRSIQDELKRLSAIGVISSHSNGFHRFYAANTAHPLFHELTRIAEMSERLPCTRRSDWERGSRANKRKRRTRGPVIQSNRPPSWGIFSGQASKNLNAFCIQVSNPASITKWFRHGVDWSVC